MPEQFALCVVFHVRPEHVDEFASRVGDNIAETHKDAGVVFFKYHKVAGEPTWILYEIWESERHSDLHRQKPDVREFFAQSSRLLAREPEIYRLEPSM
ncbi:conserved hypothetical protein [uncultured Pleomorphomonas sp.]|uniref:ABM domain-containing protein n=2 Tax=uncultured Pleomorphomonas sp. TaxID=442121 RepID=A0A212LGE6_9HYPH|nr:conserved hypothetical protein [uncultured Pleomorphomonas sp.]